MEPKPGIPISRSVNAERLVLLGWTRAILLQFAHPLIAAGIHDHSHFRAKPSATVQRLRHTVRAMLALTFGSPEQHRQTLERIQSIHRRVHGVLPIAAGPFPAGTPYSAEDPALVAWVHATLVESVPMFYELLVAPLSTAEHDEYCSEAAGVALALGARPQDVPRSRAALAAYLEERYASGEIAVSGQARELAAAVLAPPLGPLVAPGTWLNRVLTFGTLPAQVRDEYGFNWSPRDERRFVLATRALRATRRALPDVVAIWGAARRVHRSHAPAGCDAASDDFEPSARHAHYQTGLRSDQRR